MVRIKGGVNALKTRRNVLKRVKGYRFGRSTKERQAREAIAHAEKYRFAHRKDKKNIFRRLWTVRMNGALRELGTTYSKFINALKKGNIELDRKILADLAISDPPVFKQIASKLK